MSKNIKKVFRQRRQIAYAWEKWLQCGTINYKSLFAIYCFENGVNLDFSLILLLLNLWSKWLFPFRGKSLGTWIMWPELQEDSRLSVHWLIWHKCQKTYVIMDCLLCVGITGIIVVVVICHLVSSMDIPPGHSFSFRKFLYARKISGQFDMCYKMAAMFSFIL